ncbi:MAG: diaminopimelate epimerase [Acidimicrobiia bacterium]|nr:diaminopimelate epimerase [Acidimicrobiia bacterium]NNL69810.1 diaminopimelate epimerase [Acidimicrobiia bacterium]
MKFTKMEGLANDFVVFEGPLTPTPEQVAAWCDRRRGVGADGVLVAERLDDHRVRMEYWNADGGRAEMCGNGLRCVARFAFDRGWTSGPEFVVVTDLGDYPVEVKPPERVRAMLGRPVAPEVSMVSVAGSTVRPMSMGNPHAVLLVDNTAEAPVAELGPVIEVNAHFPDRTNVEFVSVRDRTRIEVRTWERGVGETLACGTGAGAAAVVANREGLTDAALTVGLLGGDLDIEIDGDTVWMEGPARYVFDGELAG